MPMLKLYPKPNVLRCCMSVGRWDGWANAMKLPVKGATFVEHKLDLGSKYLCGRGRKMTKTCGFFNDILR